MDTQHLTSNMSSGKHSIHTSERAGAPISSREKPPTLRRLQQEIMEYAGEFFGTMILVILGNGANCQVILGSDSSVSALAAGNWTSLSLAWATAVAMGVWISGGGHVNPAVTIAFATWRSFPWRKVPGYIVAQLLGAIVGAAIVYATYFHAIDIVEGGHGIRTMKTAGLFGTVPLGYLTSVSCFFSEFLNTAILLLGVLVLTDTSRTNIPPGLVPIGVWVLVYGIAAALGIQTGFALNPARDLGPRILTAMVGYGGQVFSMRHQYWIWTPIIATTLGALVGTAIYDIFLYNGHESLANKWFKNDRLHQATADHDYSTNHTHEAGSIAQSNSMSGHKEVQEPTVIPV